MKIKKELSKKNFLEDILEANGMIFNNLATEVNLAADGELCPFTRNPHSSCYCVDINSSKVLPILYYCGGNFENCEIYRRLK
ncbi:MAG: hypothetical protein HY097_02225 [Nitrospinae bacterium]|nr:hypothetical protein [Nitrospinota bacterium]